MATPQASLASTSETSALPAAAVPRVPIETIAWVVLWGALAVFLLLSAGGLAGLRWYYLNALEARPAHVQTIGGTLLARGPVEPTWVGLPADGTIQEGQTLRTDGTSQGLLTLPDYSTLVVSPGTELRFSRMGISRFTGERHVLRLELLQGRIHVGVAPPVTAARDFTVMLQGGAASLEEGSYTLTASPGQGHVRVGERGVATVVAEGSAAMVLAPGQRVQWSGDGQISGPEAADEELIYNGDFAWGLQGWQVGNSLGFRDGTDVEGQATVENGPLGQPVVTFARRYSHGTHCETYLFQPIDRDVSEYSRLVLTVDFQVRYQSLSGGGYMGSEYPMAVRLVYRAVNGEEHTFFTGFYAHNETGNRIDSGQAVPQDQWRTVSLPLKGLFPQPQRIVSVQVSASGWDYSSQLRSVSLSGR